MSSEQRRLQNRPEYVILHLLVTESRGSAMEMTFRNAAFGGFNRQDVMDYIANAARESGERIAAGPV